MARTPIFEEREQGTIYFTKAEKKYLKENGYQKAKLFRQAIKALQEGKWKYSHTEE